MEYCKVKLTPWNIVKLNLLRGLDGGRARHDHENTVGQNGGNDEQGEEGVN